MLEREERRERWMRRTEIVSKRTRARGMESEGEMGRCACEIKMREGEGVCMRASTEPSIYFRCSLSLPLSPSLSLSHPLSFCLCYVPPLLLLFFKPWGFRSSPPPILTPVTVACHIGSADIQQDGRSMETKL